jgi:hypothetical protein
MESALQATLGSAMVAEGRIQQLAESGAVELRNIIVAFRTELDNRTAARTSRDETLRDELRALLVRVHEKFVELDGALARIRVSQPASAPSPGVTATTTSSTTPAAAGLPQSMPDPWAAAAAAAAARSGAGPQTSTPMTSPPGIDNRKYKVEYKNWGGHRNLDLDVNPEGFVAWRERALGYLSADRPDIRKLLLWAERQVGIIGEADELRGFVDCGVAGEPEHVSYVIFEAVKTIMTDALLSRARACGDGRGLELWRRLHAEWRGNAPQVIAAKARRFQDPPRCSNIQKLWEALPLWEQLGSEVVMGGYPVPEWVKAQALDKLVPTDLLNTIVGRPELADFSNKIAWVKSQMEHARGASQAGYINGDMKSGKHTVKDMDIGALAQEEPTPSLAPSSGDSLLWSLQSELGRCSVEGDWDSVNALSGAIYALKGKGKGKGQKGGGKGSWNGKGGHSKGYGKNGGYDTGKGGTDDGKNGEHYKGGGKNGGTFDGYCNYCSGYGHRKSQCKKLDADLAKGGGKGKKGGKGMYFVGGDDYKEEEEANNNDPANTQDPHGADEWWVGAAFSLSRELGWETVEGTRRASRNCPAPPGDYQTSRKSRIATGVWSATTGPQPLRLQNSYRALGCDCGICGECDAEGAEECSAAPGEAWPRPSPRFVSMQMNANLVKCKGDFPNVLIESQVASADMEKCKGDFATVLIESQVPRNNNGGKVHFKDFQENFDEELKRHAHEVLLLTRDGDKAVFAMARESEMKGQFKLVEAVVDSGAEESVAPPKIFPGSVVPSAMSRSGGKYRAANGARIPNLGQQKVMFMNDDGQKCGTTFQIADVERPLISASQLAASGNSVVFDQRGGRIVNTKSGRSMALHRRGGVYILKMWVKVHGVPARDFPGQGK